MIPDPTIVAVPPLEPRFDDRFRVVGTLSIETILPTGNGVRRWGGAAAGGRNASLVVIIAIGLKNKSIADADGESSFLVRCLFCLSSK